MRRIRPEEVAAAHNDARLLAAIEFRSELSKRYRMSEAHWLPEGNCASVDPDFMFPPPRAKACEQLAVCEGCPVKTACLVRALESKTRFGVWGGTEPSERRVLQMAWDEWWDEVEEVDLCHLGEPVRELSSGSAQTGRDCANPTHRTAASARGSRSHCSESIDVFAAASELAGAAA
ncbi:WhiB family transcriptional regulator [Natronoglycomyces albus]|uniref:Transcriptional regulator WhiB n=1 Tax=Natronoglycomyces albus TaxID=2811108 RepID=A0A895XM12_9ACTN|nr:WhiB family transcriptional regulator [Natronoglycomyces albus]QSB04449.1 WhiB family transcriptional regulator [Natronoglycomyces albus]